MAWVVVFLDDLFGLPVTSGDALYRPHHPLESPAVVGGTIAVPGGDTARQDALNCASVKVCEGFRWQAKFLQPPEVEEALLRLFHHIVWVDHFSLSVMCTPRNLKLFTFSTAVPSMWIVGCSLCSFLKSTIISFVLLTLSERLFS